MLLWSKNMVIILTKWIADDPRYSKHFFLFSLLGMNVAKLSHVSLGVVWTSFESSIEIFLLYLCDQKVSPTQVEKKPNSSSSILAIYIFDIVKVLGNSLWLSHTLFMATALRVRGAFCNATHIATFIALHS